MSSKGKYRGGGVRVGTREEIMGRDTSCENRVDLAPAFGRDGKPWGVERFCEQMEEGLSPEETNQSNPFNTPAGNGTNLTLSEQMATLALRFRLLMVEVFLPRDYEVVQVAPQRFLREFLSEARQLWKSYEPLLGVHNPVTILQIENPFEEDQPHG